MTPVEPTKDDTTNDAQDTPGKGAPEGGSSTVKFKAAGVEREMPLTEALEYASKGFGADEKFRLASEKEKKADETMEGARKWTHLQELKERVQGDNPDMDAFRELAREWGHPEEEVEALIQQAEAQRAAPLDGSPPGSRTDAPPPLSPNQARVMTRMQKFFEECDKEGIDPLRAIRSSEDFQTTTLKQAARQHVQNYLTRDPIFSKMLKDSKRPTVLIDEVFNRVDGRVSEKTPFSAELIQKSAQEVADLLDTYERTVGHSRTGGGAYPGTLGGVPTSDAGLSRLHPPEAPKKDDYKDDFAGYVRAKLTYEQSKLLSSD